jgi:putative ABC transport system substrate-binding protein
MKNIVSILLIIATVGVGAVAQAQQPKKIPRIGYVATTAPDTPNNLAFRRRLRDLGYIEGKNILVEDRYAEGKADRIPSLVAELVQLKVDILVSRFQQRSARRRSRPRQSRLLW